MTSPHLEAELLAQLAEGTLDEPEATAARQHLAECRSCLASYADAVRYRAAWLADPEQFRLEGSEARIARSLFPGSATPARSAKRPLAPRLALAGVAAALLVSIWIPFSNRTRDPGVALDPVVARALSQSSAQGLVLPGAEQWAAAPRPENRSGTESTSLALERETREAVAAYEREAGDLAACSRLVAALLAGGEVETASDYVNEGLRSHPDAVPLLIYAAEARLRMNQLPEAEQLLRRAERKAPADPLVALDLGLVLRLSGRTDEAHASLERAARSRHAQIALRAQRELAR